MKGNIEERACQMALYIIENKATVRGAAQRFGISKSTVHKDLSERLPAFNKPLYLQVKQVLDENKAERHIGGAPPPGGEPGGGHNSKNAPKNRERGGAGFPAPPRCFIRGLCYQPKGHWK